MVLKLKIINIANEFNNYFASISSLAIILKAKLNNSSNSNVNFVLISKILVMHI